MTFIASGAETNEEYHAHPNAWGSSLINMFIKSRQKAWMMMNKQLPFVQTAAMTIGSALHARFDGTFKQCYAVGPNVSSRRTKTWTEAVATEPEKTWLLPKESWLVDQMEESIRINSHASELLTSVEHEVGIRRDSPYGNYKLQCRMDIYKRNSHIVDLKTTVDVDEFAKSLHSFSYYRQLAYYMYLHYLETGEWVPFIFFVVEKHPPFRSRVIELDDDYMKAGFIEVKAALEQIGECYESGVFSDPEFELLKAPSWVKRKSEEIAYAS